MTEGIPHVGKSIKWRNRLPSLSVRFEKKSQDVDMHANCFVVFLFFYYFHMNYSIQTNIFFHWARHKVVSLPIQLHCRECVLWPTFGWYPGGTCFLFYYSDSFSHLLAGDTVTRVFVSMEMVMGWQWFKCGLCDVVWSSTGPSADYRL